jgi:hypothetical protein
MISRYRVSLGGVQMDSLDSNLRILDVGYSAPDEHITASRVANLDGFSYNNKYTEKQAVTITFELHIYSIADRNEACQKVNAWAAAGGNLTVNERDGQFLYNVRCEQYATIASARNWTDPLTITFSTTSIPYWISSTAKTLTLTGTAEAGTLVMDGNIGNALVSATITASSNTVTSLQVTAGSTSITLSGLSLAATKSLVIDYINGRYLRIRQDGVDAMSKMTAGSSDVLCIPCNATSYLEVIADNAVTTVFTVRGRWL